MSKAKYNYNTDNTKRKAHKSKRGNVKFLTARQLGRLATRKAAAQ